MTHPNCKYKIVELEVNLLTKDEVQERYVLEDDDILDVFGEPFPFDVYRVLQARKKWKGWTLWWWCVVCNKKFDCPHIQFLEAIME